MAFDRWEAAKNVLCVRLDSMGDVLLTSPAFAALKRVHPDRHLTLLTSPSGAAAGRLIPEIDDIVVYESPWMKPTRAKDNPLESDSAPDRRMIERLAAGCYDAAVIFTVYSQNPLPAALLCHLADIPLRLAHCRENPYHLLSDWAREPEPEEFVRHEVQRQLDLVATVGARCDDDHLRLSVPDQARRRVRQQLAELGIDDRESWLVVHPGSTATSRRYPPENFAAAANELAKLDFRVVFTGDRGENDLVESIRCQMFSPSHSLCGKLDLAELAALVEAAPVLISNNTGPVHVAAAVGTPVVDLYALTNPQHTPWRVPHRVLFHEVPCKYCYKSVCPHGHHDCLRLVEPEQVVQATLDLLADHPKATTRGARLLRSPLPLGESWG
jgi:lipopolysaccharide heptosyltransferase II